MLVNSFYAYAHFPKIWCGFLFPDFQAFVTLIIFAVDKCMAY